MVISVLLVMDHEACRNKVCVVCAKKTTRIVSVSEIAAIKNFVDPDYNKDNPDYPLGICASCSVALAKKRNGKEAKLSVNQTYKSGQQKRLLRSNGLDCRCTICEIAKASGLCYQNPKKKRGRPKTKEQPLPTTVKVCSLCFQVVYQGCRHQCSSTNCRRKRVYNIEQLMTPTTSERVASRTLNRCSDDMGLSTLSWRKRSFDNEPVNKVLFSADDMLTIRKDTNLSSRQTITLIEDLNKAAGQKVVETHVKTKMRTKNHRLESFFEHMMIQFNRIVKGTKISENFDQHVVIVNDVQSFIDKVMQVRDLDRDHCLVRIGMDGGGGFFKICLSAFNLMIMDKPQSSKQLAKKFVDSGVKKIFIIAIAPDTPENYFNLEKLWVAAGLETLSFDYSSCTIASDLKLVNIVLGLMSHSSIHPCCWCDIDKYNLHQKGNQRTVGSLNKLYQEFRDAFAPKSDAKHYGNVINRPLIDGNPEIPVIHMIPPPELHLLLGPVNHIYDEMNKVWPDSYRWLDACHVKKTEYQGGKFEGNDCRKLLKNVQILNELCPQDFYQFPKTLNHFDDVVHSCYGNDLLPDYEMNIAKFKSEFLKLNISVTPKVHAVFYHVEEFCSITKMGLGPWSEQASESVHHEFLKCWDKAYKIKNTDHPLYGQKLLEAIQMFNAQNL